MSRLRLEEKEQIAVLLRFLVVREETFLQICGIFEVICDLILLIVILVKSQIVRTFSTYFFQCHAILNQKCYSRIKISDILFEYEVLFRLTRDFGFVVALDLLGFSICQ